MMEFVIAQRFIDLILGNALSSLAALLAVLALAALVTMDLSINASAPDARP
jgi:hypothetical protein